MVIPISRCPQRSSEYWEAWFRRSLDTPPEIPWDRGAQISAAERDAITSSLQEFQLGEQSEGRHLMDAAREWAMRSGDPAYPRAVGLFIREEQRHAELLGRFMDLAKIPRIRRTWVDSIFRRLRRFQGLETSICVLLTAEVIAKIYYRALCSATSSPALQGICTRILKDEASHVEFQSERLAILRRGRSRWRVGAAVVCQRVLFAGAVGTVWVRHRRVLSANKASWLAYWRECHSEFRRCLKRMAPHGPPRTAAVVNR